MSYTAHGIVVFYFRHLKPQNFLRLLDPAVEVVQPLSSARYSVAYLRVSYVLHRINTYYALEDRRT
jgi:hypothetical protein